MPFTSVISRTTTLAANTAGGHWFIDEDATFSVMGGIGITVGGIDHTRITLRGSISADLGGISASVASTSTHVVIGKTGLAQSQANGVVLSGADSVLVNKGVINASGAYGASLTGVSSTLKNSGTIIGSLFGFYGSSDGGIYFNSGLIKSTGAIGVHLSATSVNASYSFENAGRIVGDLGVSLNGPSVGQYQGILENSGTIIGRTGTAISGNDGVQHVINSGVIKGDILLDHGGDIYFGIGTAVVEGTVFGGGDVDVLTGSSSADRFDGGASNDDLFGRGGNDDLRGGDGNDDLDGGAGKDKLYGDDGDDALKGQKGDDRLFGGNDYDDLWGGAGKDFLAGGAHDDTLYGQGGGDILKGGAGDDYLYGGTGNDILWGGADVDVFMFTDASIGTDRIKDFEDGVDRIDLSFYSITNQTRFFNKAVKNVNGNVEIDMTKIGAQGKIIIEDVRKADLDASDFYFVI